MALLAAIDVATEIQLAACFSMLIQAQIKRNPNLSIRDAVLKAKCSGWFIQQTMKRAGLRVFKVRKAPNWRDQQNAAAKSRARRLYREWLTKPKCVVMDDETYIKADGLKFRKT